jgi:hypothetical protein
MTFLPALSPVRKKIAIGGVSAFFLIKSIAKTLQAGRNAISVFLSIGVH